ncbi:MAG: PQQ-dependent sugar dehydrogenase [Phycisphaerales bacterium]|nr:PQQ-dependent sugar dehydrogenase [Phycisphaerales bacterium]
MAGHAAAQTPLTTTRIATGLIRPIYVTHAPGDPTRLFIIEKQGFISIVKDGVLLPTKFLDVDAITLGGTSTNSEQGLLGLAFDPDYATNGLFYIHHTQSGGGAAGHATVARYRVSTFNPDVADISTRVEIITLDDPFANHNGGWTEFGPDGHLYIAMGDGGSGCDPGGRAQNLGDLHGKLWRLDPSRTPGIGGYTVPADNPFIGVAGALPEIWAYGLRNPWRPSFDRKTGDLWIADVGQLEWEEINIQPASSTGGENYGWVLREGLHPSTDSGCAGGGTKPPGAIDPIYEYNHTDGCSITGGYVYRGCAIPDLRGTYFFSDFCSAQIWSFRYTAGAVTDFRNRTTELAPGGGLGIAGVTSFGEDADGEIYICDQTGGEIFKIIPARTVCKADYNGDGLVDFSDYLDFLNLYDAGDDLADLNCDGQVDFADYLDFLNRYEAGC